MRKRHPTRFELLALNGELQDKLREAEETIEAIRSGAVDALVVASPNGDQTLTLDGSDHAYRVLVESMKEGAVTVASDGTIFYCNARFAEMIRRPIQQIVGSKIDQYLAETDRDTFKLMFKHGLSEAARGEVNLLGSDDIGLAVYLSINSLGIYDVPAVCMVVTDLTEQKRSEEIIAAEKLARSILNQAAEAIIVADANGKIIRASHAAEAMCGESLSLKSFNDVFHLQNDKGHEIRFASPAGELRVQDQSDLLKHAMTGSIAQGIEVTLDKGNGEFRNLLLSAGPVLSPKNGVLGCTVTLTDISELKRVEAELKKAKDEADAASQAKTRFLANMSHEIRTPLGAVMGYSELLATPGLSPAQRDDFIAKIKRNGCHLSSLIDDILDLSKVESGRLQVEAIDFSLRELLYDVISAVKYRVMEKAISIKVRSEGSVPARISSDPVRLKQVLTNLVSNAVKFTERGHIELTVETDVDDAGKRRLRFLVEDTGCGLTEVQAANLFEPFRQADSSTTRKYGGTGLGLALSRGLARALGGDLVLKHAHPGQGCCFVATVALERMSGEFIVNHLSDLEAPMTTSVVRDEDIRLDGIQVLLAEDAPDNQMLVSRFLKMAGATVDVAEDGRVALELAMKKKYDVILMDVQMPHVDGLEATSTLRRQGYSSPIVALTAHAMKEERDRTRSAGCDEHLTKPINRNALLAIVRRFATVEPTGSAVPDSVNGLRTYNSH